MNNKDSQIRRELIITLEANDTLNNIPTAPQSKMNPLNLIDRLVMALEAVIKNKQKIETFKEMLFSN